VITTWTI